MDRLIVNNVETYVEAYDISRNFKNNVVEVSDPLYGTDIFTLEQAIAVCPQSILDKYKRIKFIDSVKKYYVEYENNLYFSSKSIYGWFDKSSFPEYIDKKLSQGRTIPGIGAGDLSLTYDELFDIILDIKFDFLRDMSKFIHIGKIKYEDENNIYFSLAPADDIDNYETLNSRVILCFESSLYLKLSNDISIFRSNNIYVMVNFTKFQNIPTQGGNMYGLIGKGIHLDLEYLYDMTRGPIAEILTKEKSDLVYNQFYPVNKKYKNFNKITAVSDSDNWTSYHLYNTTTFSGFGGYYGYLNGEIECLEFYVKSWTESEGLPLETNTITRMRLHIVNIEQILSSHNPFLVQDVICYVPKGETAGIRFFFNRKINLNGYYYFLLEGNAFMSPCCNLGIDVYSDADKNKFTEIFGDSFITNRGTYRTMGNLTNNIQEELRVTPTGVFNHSGSSNGLWFKMNIVKKVCYLDDNLIENIKSRIDPEPEPQQTDVDFILPDKIYAVAGDTLQLFVRGFVNAYDPYQLNINCLCTKGLFYKRYFQYTPSSSDAGTVNLLFNIKDISGNVLKTKTTSLITKGTISSPVSNKNIACFGDSLTSGGTWCAEFRRRLVGSGGTPAGKNLSNINFIGPFVSSGCNYFGVGGWTWDSYTTSGRIAVRFQVSGVNTIGMNSVYSHNSISYTVIEINVTSGSGNILCIPSSVNIPSGGGTLTKTSGSGDDTITFSSAERDSQNPLWDYDTSKMTFVPYVNKYGNGSLDAVYVLLSWNGQSAYRTDFSNVTSQIKKFADTLHSEYPNAKLKIMGIPLPSQNGGCTLNYGCTDGYGDYFGVTITALNQAKAYQDFANLSSYSSFVEYVPIAPQFDCEYSMPFTTRNVNTRIDSITEYIGTNGVHPSTIGYYQIADACFRNFVYNYC